MRELRARYGVQTKRDVLMRALEIYSTFAKADASDLPMTIQLEAGGGEYLNRAALNRWVGPTRSSEPRPSKPHSIETLARRPKWKERSRGDTATAAEFVLRHYADYISRGDLTSTLLKAEDPHLFTALLSYRRRTELPVGLRSLFGATKRKRAKIVQVFTDEEIEDIRRALEIVRVNLASMQAANSVKADIDADLTIVKAEMDRPLPRPKFVKQFLESLRDNVAKASGAAATAGLVALGAILAKYFGLF